MKINLRIIFFVLLFIATVTGLILVLKNSKEEKPTESQSIVQIIETKRLDSIDRLLKFEDKLYDFTYSEAQDSLQQLRSDLNANYDTIKELDYKDSIQYKNSTFDLFNFLNTVPDTYYLPIVNLVTTTDQLTEDEQLEALDILTNYTNSIGEFYNLYKSELNKITANEEN